MKLTKYCLSAGLRPDLLGELKRSLRPIAAIRGLVLRGAREGSGEKGGRKRKGRGREREEMREREGERKWRGSVPPRPHDLFAQRSCLLGNEHPLLWIYSSLLRVVQLSPRLVDIDVFSAFTSQ